jgi:hypothetical protein
MDVLVQHPLDGEVLAEMAELESRLSQLVFPVGVVLLRIDQHRARGTAVTDEIRLTVAGDVECADRDSALDGFLEDPGPDRLSSCRDLLGKGDVDR